MDKINISKIIEKDPFFYSIWKQDRAGVKAAIKEIVELVVDKCAKSATCYTGYQGGFQTGIEYHTVSENSILKVKEEVDYDN